jgi:hypothetical protein
MTFRLSASNHDTAWTCSECSKPITAIAAGFYNRRQLTCGAECALSRKTRRQADRRAKRQADLYGAPVANLLPDPERSESARRRELYRRTSAPPAAVATAALEERAFEAGRKDGLDPTSARRRHQVDAATHTHYRRGFKEGKAERELEEAHQARRANAAATLARRQAPTPAKAWTKIYRAKRPKAPKLDARELRNRLDVRCACGDSGGVIRKRGNLGTFHEGLRGRGHRWRPVR